MGLGLDSKELSIDLNCCFSSPKSVSDLLTHVSSIVDIPERLSTLNDYVDFLEEELRKVDAFKRELPLSVILLNDAIVKLKEEALLLEKGGVGSAVKENYASSLKGESNQGDSAESYHEKKNWMSSAQLWSTPDSSGATDSISLPSCKEREGGDGRRKPFEAVTLNKKLGGIKREVREDDLGVDDGLSLSIPVGENDGSKIELSLNCKTFPSNDSGVAVAEDTPSQQQSKKQRRCWSPELHQSFVNALLQLGGPRVATPKQIREIMQVDGLTNDEVKSHLQKYRLHIRKLQPSPKYAMPNLVDCLNRDESKLLMPLTASPEGHFQLGGGGGGSSSKEEEEDAKSESQNWKGWFFKPSSE